MSKRIYPNIVNTDWTSNTPTQHPFQVDPTTFKETISGDAEVMVFFHSAKEGKMLTVEDLYKHFKIARVKGTNGWYKNIGYTKTAISDSNAPKYSSALLKMKDC